MRLLAIDPGYSAGWAVSEDGLIVDCGALPFDAFTCPPDCDAGIIEFPQIYPDGKARPNDIVRLAYTAGELAGTCRAAGLLLRTVKPREWKGTIDKEICHDRVRKTLTRGEEVAILKRVGALTSQKATLDLWDAVALNKWFQQKLRVEAALAQARRTTPRAPRSRSSKAARPKR